VDVDPAVPLPDHVLLRCLGCSALRVAEETLVVAEDDEVQVADQRLEVDDQVIDVLDEEAMGFLHVNDIVVEGIGEVVAEEALLCRELYLLVFLFLFLGFVV